MPIRTPRGRSAAYRGLWQWPLHSPWRLAACLVVVVAVLAGVTFALSALAGSGPDAAAGPASSSPPTTTATAGSGGTGSTGLPPVAELTPTILPLSAAPQAALSAAAGWASAWANHPAGITSERWLNGLRPFTTPEYLGVLSGVDPANVPATAVTGPATPVLVSPKSVRVQVPTDALTLLILVVDTGNGEWRVSAHERVEPGAGG